MIVSSELSLAADRWQCCFWRRLAPHSVWYFLFKKNYHNFHWLHTIWSITIKSNPFHRNPFNRKSFSSGVAIALDNISIYINTIWLEHYSILLTLSRFYPILSFSICIKCCDISYFRKIKLLSAQRSIWVFIICF
jgi:hypothetical protein